jgi:hypothetical protein
MHKLNFKNNYIYNVQFGPFHNVKLGEKATETVSTPVFIIGVSNSEVMNIFYLGKDEISGYELEGTDGVLFRFATEEVYSRYDGTGEYDITLDKYGDMHIKTVNGNSIQVKLPGLSLEK